jgi:phosphoribosyl-ATP pyrophosphohydrolase
MALYSGAFDLAEGFCAPLTSDRTDGLWPTVVCDERGVALGLVYSNLESVRRSVETGHGVYWSRSRGGLWEKGLTSGDTQEVISIAADCDRDALRFTVRQAGGGFCHLGTQTCFGKDAGLGALARTLLERRDSAPAGSYTARLFSDADLLRSKLIEEAGELAAAGTTDETRWEAADVIYFALVAAARGGVDLAEIERELDRRSLKVTRRPGNAKPASGGAV